MKLHFSATELGREEAEQAYLDMVNVLESRNLIAYCSISLEDLESSDVDANYLYVIDIPFSENQKS